MADLWTAREAIGAVADPGSFTELGQPPRATEPDGPLGWPGYDEMTTRAAARTGERESVVCGTASIGGKEAVLISFEFGFLGGSLGEPTGDLLEAAFTLARERRTPLVSLIATGGSRMQEGMRALTQLQRVTRQSALLRATGTPQIAVARDPTTGGGWATLGAGADVVLALSGAQVAFAGSRVRPPGAEPAAYTAEGQFAAGQIDALVRPEELRAALADWLSLLSGPRGAGAFEPPGTLVGGPARATSGQEAVALARSPERPRAAAYLAACFGGRIREISGDRCGATDPGIRCGFGSHRGLTVAYVAQCGTATRPAGYRTATRLVSLADALGIPVLTLIDTPGAANDAEAERSGAGPAIAGLFLAMATARVPLTALLIGEGGSGGALALAAPGNTWATPDSYFSVIAPEAAAAILKRDPGRDGETADQLRLRPHDLVELGIARGVVSVLPPS
ncbi:carboxyl transferase domain-containing protein [Streptomyces sp. NBC_01197]|uniref:carboxyl transferase domain-containing protein n=1 Tax=Streptomyces sp. NBC_01197 TaxID=2903768 RepID=UPI002E0E128E|nr:acetyl-CoA carboxylase [Streptomyces sp. NBC_01197]